MSGKGLQARVSLELEYSELVRRYVEIGMGVAITITYLFASNQDANSKSGVLNLNHIFPPVQIGVAVRENNNLSEATLEFITDLKSAVVGI